MFYNSWNWNTHVVCDQIGACTSSLLIMFISYKLDELHLFSELWTLLELPEFEKLFTAKIGN